MSKPVALARHTETEALFDVVLSDPDGLRAVPAAADTQLTFIGSLPTAVDPTIAGQWRHFKGGVYEFMARVDSDDGELVLYRDATGGSWLRPLSMIDEVVESDGLPQPRFVRFTG